MRKSKASKGYTVKETAPGHLSITCDQSGKEYTRSNKLGMFCDAKPCICEQESKKFEKVYDGLMKSKPSESPDAFIDKFMKMRDLF